MPTTCPVVCFGEILWDVLPSGRQPGGAPANVAVHLHQLGVAAGLISRVGQDEPGTALLDFLTSKGLSTDYIQRDLTRQTGLVEANVDDAHEVSYQIVHPVAWDFVQPQAALTALVGGAALFVYGSLAARSPASRHTLYHLLEHARFRVFDVNLRPPHYTREVVEYLLGQAELVKMNHHELAEIMAWFGDETDPASGMQQLAEHFRWQAVCVTRGAAGALLWTNDQLYQAPGVPVEVRDTIGSGDAFLAALLYGWQRGQEPGEVLRFACAAGALVATHHGATPSFAAADVQALLPQAAS